MACDVSVNRRRRKWQNAEKSNSPCTAQVGFQLGETLAFDWWLTSDNTQTASEWLWLNTGGLLKFQPNDLPSSKYRWTAISNLTQVQFELFGSNEIFTCVFDFEPATIWARLDIQTLNVFPGPVVHWEFSRYCRMLPGCNSEWLFEDWELFLPVGPSGPSVVPPLRLTPLRCGHDCS